MLWLSLSLKPPSMWRSAALGLNYVPEPERALEEMRRVTISEGIIAVYVWDYAEGARFLRQFWDAAAAVDREALAYDQARRFPLCNPEALGKLFEGACMKEVSVRALNVITRFTSFDDYWQPFLTGQGSAPSYLATRDESTKSAIQERLRSSLTIRFRGSNRAACASVGDLRAALKPSKIPCFDGNCRCRAGWSGCRCCCSPQRRCPAGTSCPRRCIRLTTTPAKVMLGVVVHAGLPTPVVGFQGQMYVTVIVSSLPPVVGLMSLA